MGFSSRTQLLLLLCTILSVLALGHAAAAGAVFEVRRMLPLHCAGGGCHYADHLEHDARRHGRRLSPGTNFPLGGSPATETGSRGSKQQFWSLFGHRSGVGLFATGNVVWPAIVKTGLVPNRLHCIVNVRSVSIAGTTLQLPANTFYGEGKSVIIDIGTTLTYLPEKIYKATMIEIFYKHRDTLFYDTQNLLYIKHYGRVDDVFPEITLHFEGGLALNIYPHDYLLNNGSDWYFVGLRNGRSQPVNLRDMVILGDIAFSNKLVVFDLENMSVGWTDYKCSSGINLEDE